MRPSNPPPPPPGGAVAVKYKSSEGRRSRKVSDRVVPPTTAPPSGVLLDKGTGQVRSRDSARMAFSAHWTSNGAEIPPFSARLGGNSAVWWTISTPSFCVATSL